MYESIFYQLGLSEGEIKVYEFLLNTGESPAGAIIAKTGLKRGNVYNILNSLTAKGLAEQFTKNKIAHFKAEHPTKLREYTEQKAKEMQNTEQLIKGALPGLISQYNLAYHKPAVLYFEGKEGIKKIYEDTLESNHAKSVFVLRSHLDDQTFGPEFFADYMAKRKRKEIHTKIISPTEISPEKRENDKKFLMERKRWANYKAPAEIDIYGDKVAIISFKGELMGIIVESPAIAATLKVVFETIWNSLQE